jgi:fermentation-respiration switch protein FrsA (DUF1100 family)
MADTADETPTVTGEKREGQTNVRVRRKSRGFLIFKWAVRIGVLLLIVGMFIVGLDGLFYYPSKTVHYTPDDFSLAYEDVTFETSDGLKLSGWFLPAQGELKGTVIHFHGNAENISAHVTLALWLVFEGYNVFVFDYRGYGRSEGQVTRAGTIRDGHAALDYVLSRDDVDPGRVFAFGQSLGGAVATVVAAEREELRAIVLDSTFSGYRRIGSRHLQKLLFFKWLADLIAAAGLSNGYDPIDYVARIAPRPLLVIASTEDNICFAELGRELYDAAQQPKEFVLVQESEHLQTVADNIDGVQEKILRLFERAAPEPP